MAAQDAQPFHWNYPDVDDKNFELHHGRGLLLLILLLSLFLFLTLLCLYLRWAYRCCTPSPWALPSDGPTSSTGPHRPLGLDPVTINSIPVRPSTVPGDGEEAQCSICLSVLVEGEKVKALPNCCHSFHPDCVDEWLKAQSTCPLCRASLENFASNPKPEPESESV